jgi:hypothetical protein
MEPITSSSPTAARAGAPARIAAARPSHAQIRRQAPIYALLVRAGAKAKTAARVNRAPNQGFARGLKNQAFVRGLKLK